MTSGITIEIKMDMWEVEEKTQTLFLNSTITNKNESLLHSPPTHRCTVHYTVTKELFVGCNVDREMGG